MDGLGDGEAPVKLLVPAGGEIRRNASRKLVQSTLFPHKAREIEPETEERKECEGEEENEEEEARRSQSKKRKLRKGKSTPQAKAHKKLKEKSPAKATPKKNGNRSNGRGVVDFVENEEELTPPSMPNLRLEAKLTAEENSHRFAGKQMHPFFTSLKAGRRGQETTELQNDGCLVHRLDKAMTIGPIHVFESEKDDVITLDWRDWRFDDKPFASCCHEHPFSSTLEGSVESLGIKDSRVPHPSGESLTLVPGHHYIPVNFHDASVGVSARQPGSSVTCHHQVKDLEMGLETVEVGFSNGYAKISETEQREHLQGRTMSSYIDCSNQPDKRLWTDKYQPRRAADVCGNNEPVKLLKEWLQNWRQGNHQSRIGLSDGDEWDRQDADNNNYQSNSDSEDDGTGLKNVLLITGPVGSGKSAAIYACAREQGFKVLEISASENRNGAVVKQRFGEALESHFLEWRQESHMESQCENTMEFSKVNSSGMMEQESDNEVVEMIPIPDEDVSLGNSLRTGALACNNSSSTCGHGQLKPLILFEDVDIMFPEDRGFTAAIQQIAENAKGPVVLTSSSVQTILPDNLDRLEVCFTMPSKEELLQHIHMVCFLEKAIVQPFLLERLIQDCHGDIRKTIMQVQFWCQGIRRGGELQKLSTPLPFRPEAAHHLLPKLFPWDFPSQLSELVENEIVASLAMLKDGSISINVTKQEIENEEMHIFEKDSIEAEKEAMLSQNCSDHDRNELLTPSNVICDSFDSSNIPVSFSQRTGRRKLNVVMSSDSENDYLPSTSEKDCDNGRHHEVDGEAPPHCQGVLNCLNPVTTVQVCCGSLISEEDISRCSETAFELDLNYPCKSVDASYVPEFSHILKDISQRSEMVIKLDLNYPCKSVDASYVPESFFVPETEINDATDMLQGMISCDQVINDFEEVSAGYDYEQNLLPLEVDNLDKSTPTFKKDSAIYGDSCSFIAVSSHEDVEDSQNHHVEAVMEEFQVMDQCNMDFMGKLGLSEELKPFNGTDLIRESWRKLRCRGADMKHLVALEHKNAYSMVELAYCLTNVISETELLLSKCQQLDFFNLSAFLSEGSEAFSQHLQMTSTIAQHGFCFYANEVSSVGLKMQFEDEFRFDSEMLATSATREMGSSAECNVHRRSMSNAVEEAMSHESGTILVSNQKSCLFDIVQSLVPSRSYSSLKGNAFHEYLSSLGYISRAEASRLSEYSSSIKGRRRRAPRNYLSSGSLMLSPEEISLLGQYSIYGKSSSGTSDNRNTLTSSLTRM